MFNVYILASQKRGTLYIGVTNNLAEPIQQHKSTSKSFTQRYRVHRLVYAEIHERIDEAIAREKAMKYWKRQWKIDLIEKSNPEWKEIIPY